MTWLITCGAGYIGAHVARAMAGDGERVVAPDDLSAAVPARLPADVPLVEGSTLEGDRLGRVLGEYGVTGVVRLAARKEVAGSVARRLAGGAVPGDLTLNTGRGEGVGARADHGGRGGDRRPPGAGGGAAQAGRRAARGRLARTGRRPAGPAGPARGARDGGVGLAGPAAAPRRVSPRSSRTGAAVHRNRTGP